MEQRCFPPFFEAALRESMPEDFYREVLPDDLRQFIDDAVEELEPGDWRRALLVIVTMKRRWPDKIVGMVRLFRLLNAPDIVTSLPQACAYNESDLPDRQMTAVDYCKREGITATSRGKRHAT